MREIVPRLIFLKCVSHTSAIIAKSNRLAIPKVVEELLRSAYNYFSNSPKCMQKFEEFTKMFSDDAKRLLRLSGTQWLEAYGSCDRLIELWPTLQHYFDKIKIDDKGCSRSTSNEQRIYNLLTNQCVKAYVHFLRFVLNFYNSFNALYQRKGLMIHTLHGSIVTILKDISINFIVFDALPNISDIDFDIEKNLMPLKEMDLSPTCIEIIKDLPSDVLDFLNDCQNFFITSLRHMRKRF